SCSPWTTSTVRSPGSADTARSSSTKWSSTKTCIGSATSEAPRAFSSGWPSKSADARHALRRHSPTLVQAALPGLRRLHLDSSTVGSRRASWRAGWRLTALVAVIAMLASACTDGHSTAPTTTGNGADAQTPLYRRAATDSCLMRHAHAFAGLPPAMPPIPPVLFVYALAGDDVSTAGGEGPRPRAHRQLGAWYGKRSYEG